MTARTMTTAAASSLDHAVATNIYQDGQTTAVPAAAGPSLGLIPGSQAAQSAAEFTHRGRAPLHGAVLQLNPMFAHPVCLSFGDCVDALPPSLTRSISDLRELDAVLSGSLTVITGKLNELLCLLEDKTAAPLRRFELLREIAEEARAFRLGGEDKIRVATGTCETLIHHTTQLDLLANLLTTLLPASMAGTIPPPTWPHGYPVLFPAPASASGSAYRRPDFLPTSHAYGRAHSGIYSAHASGMASGYGSTTNNSGIYPSLGGGGTFGAGSLYANSVTTPAYDAPGFGGRQAANYAVASDAVRQYARAGVPLADPDEIRAQIRLENKTGPLKAWQEPPHNGGASRRSRANGHVDTASIVSGGARKRKVAGSSAHEGHYGGHSLGASFGQDPYMVNSAMFAPPQNHFGHPQDIPPYTVSAPPTAALVAPGSLAAQQQQNLGTGLGQPSSTSVLPQQAGTGHVQPGYDSTGHLRTDHEARHAMAAATNAARQHPYAQSQHPGHIPYNYHPHQPHHHHHAIPEGTIASNDNAMMAPLPKKRRSAAKKAAATDHADGDHTYDAEENGETTYAAGNGGTAIKRDRNNSSRGSQGVPSPVVPPAGLNLAHINTNVTNGNGTAKRSRASAKRQRSGESPDVGSGIATPVSASFGNSRRRGSQMDMEIGGAAPRSASSRRGAAANGAANATAVHGDGTAAEIASLQGGTADAAMDLVEEEAAYGDDGEGDGDGADDRTYCYCNRVSFGNMIGCDDNDCAREWFHLSCVGLTDPPKGEWYCDECRNRRKTEVTTASKKRR